MKLDPGRMRGGVGWRHSGRRLLWWSLTGSLGSPLASESPLFNNIEQSWAGPEKVSSEEETETGDRVVQQGEGIHPYTPIQEVLLYAQRRRPCRDLYPRQGHFSVSQKEVPWTAEWPHLVGKVR